VKEESDRWKKSRESGREKNHKPQSTSRKARKSPFIPLFQRGKEGDLNIGSRDGPLRDSEQKTVASGLWLVTCKKKKESGKKRAEQPAADSRQ
jgi:hypothetical protein